MSATLVNLGCKTEMLQEKTVYAVNFNSITQLMLTAIKVDYFIKF